MAEELNPQGTQNAGAESQQEQSGKSYTQEQINSMMASEKRTARQALLKELGFEVGDDKSYRDTLASIKQTLDANKTQAQKDAEARKLAESSLATAQANAKLLETKIAALSAGVQPDSLDDVIALASTKVNGATTIDRVLEDLKAKYPVFFGGAGGSSTGGTGVGTNPPKKPQGGEGMGKRLAQMNKGAGKSTYFKNS